MDDKPVETLIENKASNGNGLEEIDDSLTEDLIDEDGVAYQSLSESDSEDDFKKIRSFSAEAAYEILYDQLSYTKIFLDYDLQKELSLEIGVHVTNENPWKTVKKELLEEYLTDNTIETENLRAKLSLFDDNDSVLLVGYHCPGEDNVEDGVFIVYDEIESILIATELIKKLEIWKRFQVKRALEKKPSRAILSARYDSISKDPPDYPPRRPRITVEIQTPHGSVQKNTKLSIRNCSDCRDGYLELLPRRNEVFENVYRRRIGQAIQSAAQRVDREQQTDPTFPTNAHTQYFYEIKSETPEDDPTFGSDVSAMPEVANEPGATEASQGAEGKRSEKAHDEDNSEEEESTLLSADQSLQQKPIVVSKQVKELIRTLEYNQIDMYRIEYESLGKREIPRFKVPYLEEVFCFADIGKTAKRYVSQIEWHPQYSGLFVATYTYQTLSVSTADDPKEDEINKIILQSNFIFMWSFEDTLNPILSFESPREVATLSFHPQDPDCLIGGLANGQIIIWDLTDVLKNIGSTDEFPNPHREDMRKFLNWTKHSYSKDVVKWSAISLLDFSQKDRITSIKWLNSSIQLNSVGDIKESHDKNFRYFVTSSLDGTIAFYNLDDGSIPEEKVAAPSDDKKKAKPMKKKNPSPMPEKKIPKTRFSHFDRKFRPQFVVVIQEPISAFGINAARFKFQPITVPAFDLAERVPFNVEEIPFALEREFTVEDEEEGVFNNNLVATTLSGDLTTVKWKSSEADAAAGIQRQEKPILQSYPAVHDGPIVALEKNPAMPLLILTIGQNILAVWRTDFIHGVIYSQRRDVELTDCKWSSRRPSVFFLTRVDGCVEIWDLLSNTKDPCLVETISGGVLTVVSQHQLPILSDVLAIGDFNSNVRIFKVPKILSQFTKQDAEDFVAQIDKEVARKEKIRLWQKKWEEENRVDTDAEKKLDQDRVSTGIKFPTRESSPRKRAGKKTESKKVKSTEENVAGELKWQQMNLKRLMNTMMTIKDIDPDECNQKTLPIREQRAYAQLKRAAIKNQFTQIGPEYAEMRDKIMPKLKGSDRDQDKVAQGPAQILSSLTEFNPDEFDEKMTKKMEERSTKNCSLTLTEIKRRGRQIREILNKSSAGHFGSREMYGYPAKVMSEQPEEGVDCLPEKDEQDQEG